MRFFILTFLSLSFFVLGCKEKQSSEKSVDQKSKGIHWHRDGMKSALAQAKTNKTPLFVYWGAEWCPPCNVVKATHFKDESFIQATRKFLPVYLDGDTEDAQTWGEKLKASGYPTLMVLNSDGQEVARLSPSVSPKEFAEALNSVHGNLFPIKKLIDRVLSKKSVEVAEKDWKVLASYSWQQESEIDWVETFKKLDEKVPEKKHAVEKSQFFVNYLVAKIKSLKKDEKLSRKEAEGYQKRLLVILNSELILSNYQALSYYSKSFVENLFGETSEESQKKNQDSLLEKRNQFVLNYKEKIARVRDQKEKGSYEHIIGFYPVIELAELKGLEITVKEKDEIKKEMLAAFEKIDSSYEQAFVTSETAYILDLVGFSDEAKQVLLKSIKKSKTPYYAMASLAYYEKKRGNKEQALLWIERAYNTAEGRATKLQWGTSYLLYMMDLSPENKDKIVLELQKFFLANLKYSDAFLGRNKKRLDGLAKKLKPWAKEQKEITRIQTIKSRWLQSCEKSRSKTDYYQKNCKSYFSDLI